MADIDLETRSTDGSDSEGSLCDFVTKDDDDNDIVSSGEEEDEPEPEQAEFNFGEDFKKYERKLRKPN